MITHSKKRTIKTFVTIVLHSENLELRKDPGQIPYHAYKELGYDSTLVTYYYPIETGRSVGAIGDPPKEEKTINRDYPYLKSEVDGLKIHFLTHKGRGKFYEKAVYDYLLTNASSIDVLNLLHFNSENIFYTFLYKLLNPKGKVYLKLDIDISFYEKKRNVFNTFSKVKLIEKTILKLFFKIVTVISAESRAGLEYFYSRFRPEIGKLILLPNGVDSLRINKLISKIKTYNEKENIVLTVGRIGNPQKNNELLMEAIAAIENLKDWRFYFVGPIEKGFDKIIVKYFETYPKLNDRVVFTGATYNPEDLYVYYNRAKVFCLTSEFEGFPLACCEAAFFGNYMLLSDKINAFDTLTNNGKNGSIFSLNIDELRKLLTSIINNKVDLSSHYNDTISYSRKSLVWQSNIKKLELFF